MKIEVDLTDSLLDLADEITRKNLIECLNNFKKGSIIPYYSTDPEEEAKEVKKMIKALKRVLSWYSAGGEYKDDE